MKHQVDFLELLQIDYEKYPVIAVVGGGGKTSLIYRLTDELIDKGESDYYHDHPYGRRV